MCDPILFTLLKMQPRYSQSSRENATQSRGTSSLASYKEVPPPPPLGAACPYTRDLKDIFVLYRIARFSRRHEKLSGKL